MRLREVTCPTWGLCIYTAVLFVPVLPWDWQKLKFRSPVGWEGWSSLGRLNLWPRQVYIKLTFWQASFPKTKCCWYNRSMIIQNQGETCPPCRENNQFYLGHKRTFILRTNRQISSAELSVGTVLGAHCHSEDRENDMAQHWTHWGGEPRAMGKGSGMQAHKNSPDDECGGSLKGSV